MHSHFCIQICYDALHQCLCFLLSFSKLLFMIQYYGGSL